MYSSYRPIAASPVAHPISHGYIAICLLVAGWVGGVCAWRHVGIGPSVCPGKKKREGVRVSASFTRAGGQCTHRAALGHFRFFLYFPRSTLGHSRRCHFIKGSSTRSPSRVCSFSPSSSTGVAMPTLPLLLAALFVAAVQAAVPTFGYNVVPFIPQVCPFLPMPISWAVLIIPQSFFFDWNQPGVPLPNPTTAQCDTINIKWSRGAAQGYVEPNLADDLCIYPLRFSAPTPFRPTNSSYILRMSPPPLTRTPPAHYLPALRPCHMSSMREATSNS